MSLHVVEPSQEGRVLQLEAQLFASLPRDGRKERRIVGLSASTGKRHVARPRVVRVLGAFDEQHLQHIALPQNGCHGGRTRRFDVGGLMIRKPLANTLEFHVDTGSAFERQRKDTTRGFRQARGKQCYTNDMKKALVTGGCGFVGSSIVRQLLDRGVEVRVMALPSEPTDNVDGFDVEVQRGNVLDIDACKRVVDGVDTVFHAAAIYKSWAPDPSLMYAVNHRGTFNMLEAARRAGVERTIYTASIVALGRPAPGTLGDERTEYDVWDLDFPYSRAKFHSRVLAQDFAEWGMDVRTVCPGVVFGPGDIAPTPSGKLIMEVCGGSSPPIYVDGGASYVDVRDVASVHVLAAEKGKAGEIYLATAHNLSSHDFLKAVGRAVGKSRKYVKLPTSMARAFVGAMNKQARRTGKEPPLSREFFEYSLVPSYFDNGKSVRDLGATYRPIEDTIRDALAWFRTRGMM